MWVKLIATVILGFLLQHVIRFTFLVNTFQKVFNHAPGPCKQLPSVVRGAEKAFLLPNGLLFITSGFNMHWDPKYPAGKLLRFDLDSGGDDAEEFRIEGGFDGSAMSPHGLSAWQDPKTGEVTLFVVNHDLVAGERVEVFRHDGTKTSKTLKYVKSIKDPKITILNDVVATGPDSFYGTIFVSYDVTLEYFALYGGGGVLLYDQGKTTVLETGLMLANGIDMSPDKQYLYVVEGGRRNLITYQIQPDKTIRRVQVFDTQTGPDNIHVEASTGDLWIGAHPNNYMTAWHLSFPAKNYVAYSQVLRMKVKDGNITSVREVYANDGSEIRGSSMAVPYKNKLFIGSVMEKAIVCELVYPG